MNMISMLLIISPQVLIQYDLKDEHIISKILNITYNDSFREDIVRASLFLLIARSPL